jgi:hypothetical protein
VGFWISFPCIGRTRVGFSVSDWELRRAFPRWPRLTEAEKAEIDRKAKAFADRGAPFVAAVVKIVLIAAAVFGLCWLVSLVAAHAGTCRYYADGNLGVTRCENGTLKGAANRPQELKYGRLRCYGNSFLSSLPFSHWQHVTHRLKSLAISAVSRNLQ